MDQWNEYFNRMLQEKQDFKERRKDWLSLWATDHPVDLKDKNLKEVKVKYKKLNELPLGKKIIDVSSENSLNAFGLYILKNDYDLKYDEVLYLDYTWLINNFYNWDDNKIAKVKNLIYSQKHKYFLIKNVATGTIAKTLNEKTTILVRNTIAEQIIAKPELKVVLSGYGTNKIQPLFIEGLGRVSKNV